MSANKHLLIQCVLGILLCSSSSIAIKNYTCIEEICDSYPSCIINGYNSSARASFLSSNNREYIKQLIFINSTVSSISFDILTEFKNLKKIDLRNNNITEINRNNCSTGVNLQIINLSHNQLTEIQNFTFRLYPKLDELNLSHNKIGILHQTAFRGSNKLTKINLSHNEMRDIPSNLFSRRSPLISDINLSANFIQSLNGSEFFNLTLIELNLSDNQIKQLNESVLKSVNNVKMLNLNNNHIDRISIKYLENIEQLSVNNNNLTVLKINFIKTLYADNNQLRNANLFIGDHIIKLSLANNKLSNLNFIKTLSNLAYLDLSYNPIQNEHNDRDLFSKLTKLQTLILKSVNLNGFDFELFSPLENLEILDISYNQIKILDLKWFAVLENLHEFYINDNQLGLVGRLDKLEKDFPNLNAVSISGNPWFCNVLIEMFKMLKQLNIKVPKDRLNRSNTDIHGISCNNETTIAVGDNGNVDHNCNHSLNNITHQMAQMRIQFDIMMKSLNENKSCANHTDKMIPTTDQSISQIHIYIIYITFVLCIIILVTNVVLFYFIFNKILNLGNKNNRKPEYLANQKTEATKAILEK